MLEKDVDGAMVVVKWIVQHVVVVDTVGPVDNARIVVDLVGKLVLHAMVMDTLKKRKRNNMVLDYKKDTKFALANGIKPQNSRDDARFHGEDVCEGITFTNFYHLCLNETVFKNCTFENCHEISAENCRMSGCIFKNVDNVNGQYTDFADCVFENCCSNGPLLIINCGGKVNHCTFDTITTFGEDGYVIYSLFSKRDESNKYTNCKFVDCQVESEDGKLCHCVYYKPFLSLETVQMDNMDYDTCEVLR